MSERRCQYTKTNEINQYSIIWLWRHLIVASRNVKESVRALVATMLYVMFIELEVGEVLGLDLNLAIQFKHDRKDFQGTNGRAISVPIVLSIEIMFRL